MERNDGLLDTREAAAYLGVSTSWVEKDRLSKARIPFVRIGRAVRYRPEDIDAFVEKSRRRSTSDTGAYDGLRLNAQPSTSFLEK